jgi:hypothetical protein
MVRTRLLAAVVITVVLMSLFALPQRDQAATPQPTTAGVGPADNEDTLAAQIKGLQKQVTDLQGRLDDLQKVRIIAAGTATWIRPDSLANRTSVHVKLPPAVTAQLGKDYVVMLTNRFPQTGHPYLAPYWSPGVGGFDISLVETTLANGSTVEYARATRNYLVDWIVVKR